MVCEKEYFILRLLVPYAALQFLNFSLNMTSGILMKLDIKFHTMRNGSILNLKEIDIKLVQYVLQNMIINNSLT